MEAPVGPTTYYYHMSIHISQSNVQTDETFNAILYCVGQVIIINFIPLKKIISFSKAEAFPVLSIWAGSGGPFFYETAIILVSVFSVCFLSFCWLGGRFFVVYFLSKIFFYRRTFWRICDQFSGGHNFSNLQYLVIRKWLLKSFQELYIFSI